MLVNMLKNLGWARRKVKYYLNNLMILKIEQLKNRRKKGKRKK